MTKQSAKKTKNIISARTLAALIVSLIIISILPLYMTFVLNLWPDPGVVVADYVYLLILAGFVSVFTDWYRPKWLTVALLSLGALNFAGLFWLYTVLNSLNPTL